MNKEELLKQIEQRLIAKNIYDLRQIGRAAGMQSPSSAERSAIISGVLAIASGQSDPVSPSGRGAHPKSPEYDRALLGDIQLCRTFFLSDTKQEDKIIVSSPDFVRLSSTEDMVSALYMSDGDIAFTTGGKYPYKEIYVSSALARKYSLTDGDRIEGVCRKNADNSMPEFTSVEKINGKLPEDCAAGDAFYGLPVTYPAAVFNLGGENCGVTRRIINLFCPLAKGQRALICAPAGTDPVKAVAAVAEGLGENHPNVKKIILVTDGYPEEIAEYFRTCGGCDIIYTGVDQSEKRHLEVAETAFAHCRRLVENGFDVALFAVGTERLARSYSLSSVQLMPQAEQRAAAYIRRLFGAARTVEGGGSLTVAAVSRQDFSSSADVAVYNCLKDCCNMRVELSPRLARSGAASSADALQSYSYAEDFAPQSARRLAFAMRNGGYSAEEIVKLIENCPTDESLAAALKIQ